MQSLSMDLPNCLAATPHIKKTCMFCLKERSCIAMRCGRWTCDECIERYLNANKFCFECPVCMTALPLESIITHPDIAMWASQLRNLESLLKNIDAQLCTCGTLLVNETMFSRQNCRCGRNLCFFCNKDWDTSTMKNQKHMCRADCEYARRLTFELVPFVMSAIEGKKLLNRRMCPKCFKVGAYDEKCKYHQCNSWKHTFCFLCLKPEVECKCKSSFSKMCVSEPVTLTFKDFPRLLKE